MRCVLFFVVFVLFFKVSTAQVGVNSPTVIQGIVESTHKYDSIRLFVFEDVLIDHYFSNPAKTVTVPLNNGRFRIVTESQNSPRYFTLHALGRNIGQMGVRTIFKYFILAPGDSINIDMTDTKLVFSGRGAEKYQCLQDIENVKRFRNEIADSIRGTVKHADTPMLKLPFRGTVLRVEGLDNFFISDRIDSVMMERKIHILTTHQFQIEPEVYKLIKTDLFYEKIYRQLRLAREAYVNRLHEIAGTNELALTENQRGQIESAAKQIERYYHDSILQGRPIYSEDTGSQSRCMLDYIYYRLVVQSNAGLGSYDNSNAMFASIIQGNSGLLRERLIAKLFLEKFRFFTNSNYLFTEAKKIVRHGLYKDIINRFQTGLVGSFALPFALPDKRDSVITLSSLRGKVIFMDFWYTGCSNCALYYKSILKPIETAFQSDTNVVFITISADASKDQWLRSLGSRIYTSDDHSNVINVYTAGKGFRHPILSAYNITSYPRPLLIDKNGKIFKTSADDLRNYTGLLTSIEAALNN